MTVKSKFDYLQVFQGPHIPDTEPIIVKNRVRNIGTSAGSIWCELAELTEHGDIKDALCRTKNTLFDISPNGCGMLYAKPSVGTCTMNGTPRCDASAWIKIKKPKGVYYFGLKTWGEDEDVPDYPPIGDTLDNATSFSVTFAKKCDTLKVVEKAPVVCTCIADAYVAQSGGGYNTSELKAEGNADDKYVLLGFQLPAGIDLTEIDNMYAELYVKDYGGDYDWEGDDYYGDTMFFNALPAFNEATVNWSWHFNNCIYLGQSALKTPIAKNNYYRIFDLMGSWGLSKLFEYIVDSKIYISFHGSDTWQKYSSKEGTHPPKLIIYFKKPEE